MRLSSLAAGPHHGMVCARPIVANMMLLTSLCAPYNDPRLHSMFNAANTKSEPSDASGRPWAFPPVDVRRAAEALPGSSSVVATPAIASEGDFSGAEGAWPRLHRDPCAVIDVIDYMEVRAMPEEDELLVAYEEQTLEEDGYWSGQPEAWSYLDDDQFGV